MSELTTLPYDLSVSMTEKAREQAAEQGVITIQGNRLALDGLAKTAGIALPKRPLHVLVRGHSTPIVEAWDPIYQPRMVNGLPLESDFLPHLNTEPDFDVVIKDWDDNAHVRDMFAQQLLNGDLWKISQPNKKRPAWAVGIVRQVAPEIGRSILARQTTLGAPLTVLFEPRKKMPNQ